MFTILTDAKDLLLSRRGAALVTLMAWIWGMSKLYELGLIFKAMVG